jgi:alanine transaminase
MYAFVKFNIPNYDAKAEYEIPLDEQYCISLLEETGICVVPGSGFGQIQGTLHFRTTFLPPKEQILDLVSRLASFHQQYSKRCL